MTALFVVMFLEQWEQTDDHIPALVGIICSVACLLLFGRDYFIIPAMICIVLCFLALRKKTASENASQKEETHVH